jgi:hypothetical protein
VGLVAGQINKSLVSWNNTALSAGTANGTVQVALDGYCYLSLILQITATSGGSSPTIAINLQTSFDDVNWGALPASFWFGDSLPAAVTPTVGLMQINYPAADAIAMSLVRATYTVVSTPTVSGSIQLLAR